MSAEKTVHLPVLAGASRRTVMKGLGAALGFTAFGVAVWPIKDAIEETSIDEFLQRHYKELNDDDKRDIFARLEQEQAREQERKKKGKRRNGNT